MLRMAAAHPAQAAGGCDCLTSCSGTPRACHASLILFKSSRVDRGMPCRHTVMSCWLCVREEGVARPVGALQKSAAAWRGFSAASSELAVLRTWLKLERAQASGIQSASMPEARARVRAFT